MSKQQITSHNLTSLGEILKVLWSQPSLPPALLVGPPGCGKTTLVRDTAATLGLPCHIMMANLCEPSDFGGLPIASGDEVRMLPLSWAKRIAGTNCVLFLDEINTARPATLATLLRVALDKVVGEVDLGPGVRIVAAMNPAEESAHGWELPPALAGRFSHYRVADLSVSNFKKWALEQPETAASPNLHKLVEEFVADTMHNPPTGGPFGSPRSWWQGLQSVAAAMDSSRGYLGESLLAASVGAGNAIAWNAQRNQTTVDWKVPQSPSIIRKVILTSIDECTARGDYEPLWPLLAKCSHNNIAATYATVGTKREILERVSQSPEAFRVLKAIKDAAMVQPVPPTDDIPF